MVRIVICIVLFATSLTLRAAQSEGNFSILVEAQDCSAMIAAPGRIKIGPVAPAVFRTESLSRGSAIALKVSLEPQNAYRVRGSYLTACGDISVNSSAEMGRAMTVKSGKLWLRVTLTPMTTR